MQWSWALVLAFLLVKASGYRCPSGHFKCSRNDWCVPPSFVCDGEDDCEEGEDEQICSGSYEKPLSCIASQFSCADGSKCIAKKFVCDGQPDCPDASDEKDCAKTIRDVCEGFKCFDASRCISALNVCDGENDCDDKSDEHTCLTISSSKFGKRKSLCHNGFKCSDGTCLEESKLCNGKKDCVKGEDEINCSSCRLQCEHFCRHHVNGTECGCRPGFKLVNGKDCVADDVCMATGCSQKCFKKDGKVACSCSDGFNQVDNKCTLSERSQGQVLMFASGSLVRQRDEYYHESSTVFEDSRPTAIVAAFDIDLNDGRTYAIVQIREGSQYVSQVMMSAGRSRSPENALPSIEFSSPLTSIAVDWITKNLYLFQPQRQVILVCRKELCVDAVKGVGLVTGLVLDPPEGRLFWANTSPSEHENSIGVFQSDMDGKNQKNIVTGAAISSMALDRFANRLYWINEFSGTIGFVHLQFGTKGYLSETGSPASFQYGLSVFGDSLYWIGKLNAKSSIYTCDKLTGENKTTVVEMRLTKDELEDAKVMQPLMQPSTANPCRNSRCSHMCVLAGPKKVSCLCPKYYDLVLTQQCEINTDLFYMATDVEVFGVPAALVTKNDLSAQEKHLTVVPNIKALAVDAKERIIYAFENKGTPKIISYNLRGEYSVKAIPAPPVSFVESMKFDPLNRVLYWLDLYKSAIMIFNPARNETSKIDVQAVKVGKYGGYVVGDFAVDYYRGRVFVILHQIVAKKNAIITYALNGTVLEERQQVSPNPYRITVDISRGTLYIFDANEKCILEITGSSTLLAQNVDDTIQQLEFWNDQLVWSLRRQRGFYIASTVGFKPKHITKTTWKNPTTALAFVDKPFDVLSKCSRANGGCSHTCLSTVAESVCMCPIGMVLGADGKQCVPAPQIKCSQWQVACANGYQCILQSERCDQVPQCDDGSDETDLCEICGEDHLRCANGHGCYLPASICDNDYDCLDGSDERNCTYHASPTCTEDEYNCMLTSDCISKNRRCDGRHDCLFDDDEFECTQCSSGHFCPGVSKHCLQERDFCDGFSDCADDYDEKDCGPCPPMMFECDGLCLAQKFRCDGRAQCRDARDEVGCSSGIRNSSAMPDWCARLETEGHKPVWCDDSCVHGVQICDNHPDCLTGEDEHNCPRHTEECSAEHFKCANGKCIFKNSICDGEDDCGDGSDENDPQCDYVNSKRINQYLCAHDEFRCADGEKCISIEKVCDHHQDCSDGSDEHGQCERGACETQDPCQAGKEFCHNTPNGYLCHCPRGYDLLEDGTSCGDIDECALGGLCSHYCTNTKGGFNCSCGIDYKLLSDNKTCVAEGNPVLVFVSHNEIRAVSRRHKALDLLAKVEREEITGLTFDSVYDTIYWSAGQTVTSLPIGDNVVGGKPVVVANHVWQPKHLSFDWLTENMYFVDGKQHIEACNKNFTFCTHLPTPQLNNIRSLALLPTEGVMFFSYYKGDSPSQNETGGVFRSGMDGSQPVEIINATFYPGHLQVDFIRRRLYVADPALETVKHYRFDGSDHVTLLRGHHMHSFALFPDHIFFSEGFNILKADWFAASKVEFFIGDAYATHMQVMHHVRQPPDVRFCSRANCTQLCLLRPNGFVCACDALYNLAADNRTCVKQDEHADLAGLHSDACGGSCENGGICTVRTDRAYCLCPRGFSGAHCELEVGSNQRGSSPWWAVLWSVMLVGFVAIVVTAVFYVKKQMNNPGKPQMREPYRATDMRKLLQMESETAEHHSSFESKPPATGTMNPLYSVEIEPTDICQSITISQLTQEPEVGVREANLVDL